MYSSGEKSSAAFSGIERLLAYFRLSGRGMVKDARTLEEAVEILNEETDLILIPTDLEEQWYRTAVGAFLVQDLEGVDRAVVPDWRGRYYFVDEGTGQRVYLNESNCGQFRARAYAAALDFPKANIPPAALLRRLFRGVSRFEGLLLVAWALLGGGLWVLLAQLAHHTLSNGGLAAVQSAFLQIVLPIGAISLVEALLFFSGRQVIRRSAQKGALAALPGIGARLYDAERLDSPEQTAFRLSAIREDGGQWLAWMLTTLRNLVTAVVIAVALAGCFPMGFMSAAGIALALYAVSAAVCVKAARRPSGVCADALRRQWFRRRAVERRLGVERPFPEEERGCRLEVPQWIGWGAAAVMTLPLIGLALNRGISLARLTQALLLYLPVTALPLTALLGAGGAGRALSNLLALLPAAQRRPKGDADLPPMGSVFELKDVTFSYPDRERPVLRGVSLRLYPGETVGILGGTGAGKTTLARLMTGILKPTGGNLYYGGLELARCNGASLRRRIACRNGSDILLTDRMPQQRDGRTCVVFSARETALAGCDRILVLADGVLTEKAASSK